MEISKEQEIIAANLILPIIKDIITPKIINVLSKYGLSLDETNIYSDKFSNYLTQRYVNFLTLDTLALSNTQTLFDILYEPIVITSSNKGETKEEYLIDDMFEPLLFLNKYYRIIIIDTAGTGKSTLLKKFFKICLKQKQIIPILIELRHINNNNSIVDEIKSQLSFGDSQSEHNICISLLSRGNFAFFLDGYDEISNTDKDFVTKDISKFMKKFFENFFIMTSRQDESLASFNAFQRFNIKPLDKDQSYSLIKRYDTYSYKKISEKLIEEIDRKNEDSINEYLENPLLVSLLFRTYDYKKDIPLKKTQFYRQIFEALFEQHDLTKDGSLKREKKSNLHLDDFERVLRYVAYFTAVENKLEYEKDYIINVIEKTKKYIPNLTFNSSDLVKDLLLSVPMFKTEGNYIKWTHKSLQDYFAAKFIWLDERKDQNNILLKIYDNHLNQRFSNIVELFYELDTLLFETTFLYWFLEDFRNYAESVFNDCPNIDQRLIRERIGLTFQKTTYLIAPKKEDMPDFINIYLDKKLQVKYNSLINESLDYLLVNVCSSNDLKFMIAVYTILSKPNITFMKELLSKKYSGIVQIVVDKQNYNCEFIPKLKEGRVYKDIFSSELFGDSNKYETINKIITRYFTINYTSAMLKLEKLKHKIGKDNNNELLNW